MRSKIVLKLATAGVLAVVLFFLEKFATASVVEFLLLKTGQPADGFMSLGLTKNHLFAFSLPMSSVMMYAISILVISAVSVVYGKYFLSQSIAFSIGYGFILAGAASNLVSRIAQGFVWDFVHIQMLGLRGVWNFADGLILIGMILWAAARTSPR